MPTDGISESPKDTLSKQKISIVAVGPPGHGKSNFLNELAGLPEKFKTFAGATEGSKPDTEVGEGENCKTCDIQTDSVTLELELFDTPGYPRPDEKESEDCFNDAVKKCNRHVHAVVYVVKPERKNIHTLKELANAWNPLQELRSPLILLANGTEASQREKESDEAFRKRKEDGLKTMREVAFDIRAEVAPNCEEEPMLSYCIDDLESVGKDLLARLSEVTPQASALKPKGGDAPLGPASHDGAADRTPQSSRPSGDTPPGPALHDGAAEQSSQSSKSKTEGSDAPLGPAPHDGAADQTPQSSRPSDDTPPGPALRDGAAEQSSQSTKSKTEGSDAPPGPAPHYGAIDQTLQSSKSKTEDMPQVDLERGDQRTESYGPKPRDSYCTFPSLQNCAIL